MTKDLEPLSISRLWTQRWPESPPVAQWVRDAYHERWVRFHSLPGSKRYPDNEAEERVVLSRYNTVLSELDPGDQLLVLTQDWTTQAAPASPPLWPRRPDGARAPRHWRTLTPSEQLGERYTQCYFEVWPWPSDGLDDLLRAVANDEISNVILGPPDLRWLHMPYDGGADAILPTTTERDLLRTRHHDWLSHHPEGL